ncbi:MAG: TRAP transporter substrate-binding protein [Deltaproteobacteria bacterium]|nr:TRAP transporter substrate-binding protein [Deltaproteobacteria bacterium]MBT4643591.1 TRAP transporter substrate-binding protein [Deltaproteobacteria bacterium]MBT6504317.1 TRAP transporter substrate-binding protein [Deltaproteobacteria bacterium]MBT6610936.1 TRAP transporter substrate-binding protein [Deltaproteobacteria bacterium]MBT7154152.1 TRAP transporter substrate-binding protein [Deltaproteobacteria bacterium]
MRRLAYFGLIVSLLVAFTMSLSPMTFAKTLKIGLGDPIDSDQGVLALRFKKIVETTSGGRYTVDIFPAGQLGDEQKMVKDSRRGSIDGAVVAVNNITPFAKSVGILTLPYLIQSFDDAVAITTGALGEKWRNVLIKDAGVRVLGWSYSNFRVLTNSKKPVTMLSDLKGLKIRVPKNAIMIATWKALGAEPIPMAWPETFTALQQRVVDGQDNPHITNYTMKFYEVQKYTSEVHYLFSLQPLIFGEKFFRSLSDADKAMFTRAGIEAQQANLLFSVTESSKAKANMVKKGVTAMDIEDEEKWSQIAMDKVWPMFYKDVGGKAAVDKVVKALGR